MAEAYEALVRNGPMTRSDLAAELSTVKSPNAITQILQRLQHQGAVEKAAAGQRNDGETFRARPPQEVFERLVDESQDLKQKALEALGPAYDHARAVHDRDTEWSVMGPTGVAKVLQGAVDGAQRRLLVIDSNLAWCRPRHIGRLAERRAKMSEVLFVVPKACTQVPLLVARNIPHVLQDGVLLHAVVADSNVLIPRQDHRGLLRSANPQLVDLIVGQIVVAKGRSK